MKLGERERASLRYELVTKAIDTVQWKIENEEKVYGPKFQTARDKLDDARKLMDANPIKALETAMLASDILYDSKDQLDAFLKAQ
jgi:hypothetical protein